MTSQKIRAPRAAAGDFQEFFLRPAEFAQAGKTGNDDLLAGFARRPWMTGNDGLNQLAVNFIARHGLLRIKSRMIKKLPRHARERKTAVCVVRFWVARSQNPFARRRVHLISPNQFVRKSETVAREFKTPRRSL